MTHLKIRNHCQGGITLIDNNFIDYYMAEAHGEYVKVYLLLLRCGTKNSELTIAEIADRLECTERDVVRALKYWESRPVVTGLRSGGSYLRTGYLPPCERAGCL